MSDYDIRSALSIKKQQATVVSGINFLPKISLSLRRKDRDPDNNQSLQLPLLRWQKEK